VRDGEAKGWLANSFRILALFNDAANLNNQTMYENQNAEQTHF
jgi:hypothetical protein